MPMNLNLGDIVELKKQHACGCKQFEIIRVGMDIKIKCKCKLDGYEWEARPFDLLRKHGCPNCKGVKRKNTKMSDSQTI